MKVIFYGDEAGNHPEEYLFTIPWVGEEYMVLEVTCSPTGSNFYRIEVDSGEVPECLESRYFEITDPRMPPCWEADVRWDGTVVLSPPSWQIPEFWDLVLASDPETVRIYQRDREIMRRGG